MLCSFLYFFRLGQIPLKDFDEAYYAGGAQEMLFHRDFITPHLNGEPMMAKPIMVYWLIALSFRLFGAGEFAARFWSALSATALVLLVNAFGKRFANARVGFLAAVMLAANYQWLDMGRDASIDMVLTLLLTSALMLLFAEMQRPNGRSSWNALLAYPLIGLACIAKGPIPVAACVGGFALYLIALRRGREYVRKIYLLPGIGLLLLIAAPWYVVEGIRHPSFLSTFLISESLGHLAGHCARVVPFWGHLQNILIFFFPWSMLLPATFVGMRGKWRTPGPASFAAYMSIGIVVLFSIGHAKLAHYLCPAFPFLALLTAIWTDEWMRRKEPIHLSVRLSFAAMLTLGFAMALALLALTLGYWNSVTSFWENKWGVGCRPEIALAILAAGCVSSALLALSRRRQAALILMTVMAVSANAFVAFAIRPKVAQVEDLPRKELARLAARDIGPKGHLAIYHTKLAGTIYYSDHTVLNLNNSRPKDVARMMQTSPGSVTITRLSCVPELAGQGMNVILARRKDFCLLSCGPRNMAIEPLRRRS